MSHGDQDDAISIVSDTTHNSEETIANSPAQLHRQIDDYKSFKVLQTNFSDSVGELSPVIPYHGIHTLQISTTKGPCVGGAGDEDQHGDDVCSEMSEVLIPLKQTSLNVDHHSAARTSPSPVPSHIHRQDYHVEQSQSLLTSSGVKESTEHCKTVDGVNQRHASGNRTGYIDIEQRNTGLASAYTDHLLKVKLSVTQSGKSGVPGDSRLCSQAVTTTTHPNTSVHRTRSTTQSQCTDRSKRKNSYDIINQPRRTSTHVVPANTTSTNDENSTEKLNLRIGKLLNTIDKTPPRQQEVIKTTVEHCMVKLQDTLERKLSCIHGDLDSINHGRLKNLILIIQSNLTRVMRFYKSLENEESSRDQSSLYGMHLQHKKNLLSIVLRQKGLVKLFKAMDRGLPKSNTSGSMNGTQNSYYSQDITTAQPDQMYNTQQIHQSHDDNQPISKSTLPGSQADIFRLSGGMSEHGYKDGKRNVKQLIKLAESSLKANKRKMLDDDDLGKTNKGQEPGGTGVELKKSKAVVDLVETKKDLNYGNDDKDKISTQSVTWLHLLQNSEGDQIPVVCEPIGKSRTRNSSDEVSTHQSTSHSSNMIHQSDVTTRPINQSHDDSPTKCPSDQDNYFSDDESVDILTATKVTECISGFDKCLPNVKESLPLSFKEDLSHQSKDSNLNVKQDTDVRDKDINKPEVQDCDSEMFDNEEPKESEYADVTDVNGNADYHTYTSTSSRYMNDKHEDIKHRDSYWSIDVPAPGQTSPTSTCISSDIFMVKTTELDRRQKQRMMEEKERNCLMLPTPNSKQLQTVGQESVLQVQRLSGQSQQQPGVQGQQSKSQGLKVQGQQSQGQGLKVQGQQSKSQGLKVQGQQSQGQGLKLQGQQSQCQGLKVQGQQSQGQGLNIQFQGLGAQGQNSLAPVLCSLDQKRDVIVISVDKNKEGTQQSVSLPSWKELMAEKTILPGQGVLSVTVNDVQHKASLTDNGKIQDSRGILFNTPAKWLSSLCSGQTVKKLKAYQQILYRGKAIQHFCSGRAAVSGAEDRSPPPIDMNDTLKIHPEAIQTKLEQATQTESMFSKYSSDTTVSNGDRYLNKLLSQSVVRLLNIKDFVSCSDLPENIWSEDFSQVKLNESVWDSVSCW